MNNCTLCVLNLHGLRCNCTNSAQLYTKVIFITASYCLLYRAACNVESIQLNK